MAAMYVCICNGVTDATVREAAANGVRSLAELTMRTGCGANCGGCAEFAEQLLHDERTRVFAVPLIAAAA